VLGTGRQTIKFEWEPVAAAAGMEVVELQVLVMYCMYSVCCKHTHTHTYTHTQRERERERERLHHVCVWTCVGVWVGVDVYVCVYNTTDVS
jgi:hypothetical protein